MKCQPRGKGEFLQMVLNFDWCMLRSFRWWNIYPVYLESLQKKASDTWWDWQFEVQFMQWIRMCCKCLIIKFILMWRGRQEADWVYWSLHLGFGWRQSHGFHERSQARVHLYISTHLSWLIIILENIAGEHPWTIKFDKVGQSMHWEGIRVYLQISGRSDRQAFHRSIEWIIKCGHMTFEGSFQVHY